MVLLDGEEMNSVSGKSVASTIKGTVQRRVYDALAVLTSIGIIRADSKTSIEIEPLLYDPQSELSVRRGKF